MLRSLAAPEDRLILQRGDQQLRDGGRPVAFGHVGEEPAFRQEHLLGETWGMSECFNFFAVWEGRAPGAELRWNYGLDYRLRSGQC